AALPYLRARESGAIPVYDVSVSGDWSWPPWFYLGEPLVERAGVALLTVLVADLVLRGIARVRSRARIEPVFPAESACWAVVLVAVLLSAGRVLPLPGGLEVANLPYLLLESVVPGFRAIRGPSRFFMVVLGVA